MDSYVAILHATRTGYSVSFPDFPGCIAAGESAADAVFRASQALRFHVDGMIEDGEAIPHARTAEALLRDREFADDFENHAIIAFVPLLPTAGERGKFLLSLDKALVAEVDRHAKALETGRSGFIEAATRAALLGTIAKAQRPKRAARRRTV